MLWWWHNVWVLPKAQQPVGLNKFGGLVNHFYWQQNLEGSFLLASYS